MITNSPITIYHLTLDEEDRIEKYIRYNYAKTWCFNSNVARVNQGYNDANKIQIRIPYELNKDLNPDNISVGDIIVKGSLDIDIQTQSDLKEYEIYNITSINNNNFGNNPHIHIGGI